MIIEKYVKLGERGQIVIPKEMREVLGIEKRDLLKVIGIGTEIIVRPLKVREEPEELILKALTKASFKEKDWIKIQKERER